MKTAWLLDLDLSEKRLTVWPMDLWGCSLDLNAWGIKGGEVLFWNRRHDILMSIGTGNVNRGLSTAERLDGTLRGEWCHLNSISWPDLEWWGNGPLYPLELMT